MIELGTYVRDKVTGFEGTVTGRVEYLGGFPELRVEPVFTPGEKASEARWLAEQRAILWSSPSPEKLGTD